MNASRKLWLKVCGITCIEDALVAADTGADAIGLNFVASSKRRVEVQEARAIADSVRGRVEIIGVVADQSSAALLDLSREIGLDALQLHGSEPASALLDLPNSFKAVGIRTAADVQRALHYPGERLLLDSAAHGAHGQSGGSGVVFDWSLVRELCETRSVILAGGLSPENVADAVLRLPLYGLDVASGVEQSGLPRRKDPEKVRSFVQRARDTAGQRG
jgi:phosphoribosylanthranilate isomerase